MISKIIHHLRLVIRHKVKVFNLCCKAGIPIQGFFHDMSKFSPTEFFESAKYYTGNRSPILACRKENGYSKAWLHHKGRNKHHFEYWYDEALPEKMPIIPYKYVVEMICDNIAAGMVYKKEKWTLDYQLNYWNKYRSNVVVNPIVSDILVDVFTKLAKDGIDKTIRKDVLRKIYDENVEKNIVG